MAYVALNGAKTYYEEKHDKGTFVKNIITDNILPGDVYIRAKELHFVTDVPRAVFLVRQVGRADVAVVDLLAGMFPDRQQDFVLSINEKDVAIVKQITPTTEKEDLLKIGAANRADAAHGAFHQDDDRHRHRGEPSARAGRLLQGGTGRH